MNAIGLRAYPQGSTRNQMQGPKGLGPLSFIIIINYSDVHVLLPLVCVCYLPLILLVTK